MAAMIDHPGLELETTDSAADRGRLRHPPELLLPLMRAARPPAALNSPVSFGRLAAKTMPSRWAGPRRRGGSTLALGESER